MTKAQRKTERRRADPAFKAKLNAQWRAWYRGVKDNPAYVARRRAYHRQRRKQPGVVIQLREHARRHREKFRVSWLTRHAIKRCRASGMACDAAFLKELSLLKPSNCPCCQVKLNYAFSGANNNKAMNDGPSLDRVDPLKGYIRGNVEIICWRCNALKRDALLHELEAIVAYMRARLCTPSKH